MLMMMIVEAGDEGNHVIATLRNLRLLLLFRTSSNCGTSDTAH